MDEISAKIVTAQPKVPGVFGDCQSIEALAVSPLIPSTFNDDS